MVYAATARSAVKARTALRHAARQTSQAVVAGDGRILSGTSRADSGQGSMSHTLSARRAQRVMLRAWPPVRQGLRDGSCFGGSHGLDSWKAHRLDDVPPGSRAAGAGPGDMPLARTRE
jgi:hypothetical protein